MKDPSGDVDDTVGDTVELISCTLLSLKSMQYYLLFGIEIISTKENNVESQWHLSALISFTYTQGSHQGERVVDKAGVQTKQC